MSLTAQAQTMPYNFTVEGRLYDNTGLPLNTTTGYVRFELLSDQVANPTCVLFREDFPPIDLTSSSATAIGVFSLRLGSGTKLFPGGAFSLASVFKPGTYNGDNNGDNAADCAGIVTSSSHLLVRIHFKANVGDAFETLSPDTRVTAVPTAMVADSANTLQGKDVSNFVLTNMSSALLQANVENVFSNTNYTKLTDLLAGSVSGGYIPVTPTAAVGFNSQRLINIAEPVGAQDAATKNYSDTKVAGKDVDTAGVSLGNGGGKVLTWDQAQNKWVAQTVSGLNYLVAGNGLTGGTITAAGTLAVDTGTTGNKIVQLSGGLLPAVDASLLTNVQYPVLSVSGRMGAITLNTADISGIGTAATRDYGTASGNLVELAGASRLPALDGFALSNINTTYLRDRLVSATAPLTGQVLTWNGSQWQAQDAAATGITALQGDISAVGPGNVNATIGNDKITSAKLKSSGGGVNRLLITNATAGDTVDYATCLQDQIMKYDISTGWKCVDVAVGTVNLVAAGNGLRGGTFTTSGTLSVDTGVAANQILQLNGAAKIPAVDGSLLVNLDASNISLGMLSDSHLSASIARTYSANVFSVGGQEIHIASNTDVALTLKGAGGQAANLMEFKNVGGILRYSVNPGPTPIVATDLTNKGYVDSVAVAGDLSGTVNAASVDKIKGRNIASYTPLTGQVLTWSGTQWQPAPIASAVNDFVNGGNSFGVATSIGTNDAQDLGFQTANVVRMTLDQSGRLGIGTIAPSVTLDVNGQMKTATYDNTGSAAIDWNRGNMQYTTDSCQAYTFSNVQDGASYTFVVKGATSAMCTFTIAGATTHFTPENDVTNASTHTVYTFFRAGSDVYITWVTGM